MPRSLFPEFAFYPLNLVPSCWRCNDNKGAAWLDDKGQRIIFSVYFDANPTHTFLKARYSANPNSGETPLISFVLQIDQLMNSNLSGLISRHVKQLKLLQHYPVACVELVSEFIRSCEVWGVQSLDEVKEHLGHEVEKWSAELGDHSWRVALYQCLESETEFMNLCIKKISKVG